MKYSYAPQKEVTMVNLWCLNIINSVQKSLSEYFTCDIRLVGSGEKRMVTMDDSGVFDLDYNLVIQKDKQKIISSPKMVKKLFIESFERELQNAVNGYKSITDSSSVVKNIITFKDGNSIKFDVAIIMEINGTLCRFMHDKQHDSYTWNQIPNSKNYKQRFVRIKKNKDFGNFKKRYLFLKNMHSQRKDEVESFSIFLEALSEFEE